MVKEKTIRKNQRFYDSENLENTTNHRKTLGIIQRRSKDKDEKSRSQENNTVPMGMARINNPHKKACELLYKLTGRKARGGGIFENQKGNRAKRKVRKSWARPTLKVHQFRGDKNNRNTKKFPQKARKRTEKKKKENRQKEENKAHRAETSPKKKDKHTNQEENNPEAIKRKKSKKGTCEIPLK